MLHQPAQTTELVEMPFGYGLGWAEGTVYLMGARISQGNGNLGAASCSAAFCENSLTSCFCYCCTAGSQDRGGASHG